MESRLSSLLGALPAEGLLRLHILLLASLPLQQCCSLHVGCLQVSWTCGHQECLLL